ncbi:hypothetical protein D4R89_13405 [bacterium]|nr:MAG: hypothetical protein D4R89_13405 [bacterium]
MDEQAEAGVAEDFGLAGVVGQADAVFGEKRDGVEKSNRPDPDLTFPVFELILYTAPRLRSSPDILEGLRTG